MKKLISLLLVLTLALSATAALAATEPNSKTIEETLSYETDTIKITIGDNTVYGKTVTVNMKEMAENALKSGDEAIAAAVLAMIDSCFNNAK